MLGLVKVHVADLGAMGQHFLCQVALARAKVGAHALDILGNALGQQLRPGIHPVP